MHANCLMLHKHALAIMLSRTLGGLFVASALLKFQALQTFQGEVRLYLEVYFPLVFIGNERIIAISTCVLELILGLCALAGIVRNVLSIAFVAILSFFVWLTGINLFFPSLMGSIESCGCFGELIHFTPRAAFIKSVILEAMAIFWFSLECLERREQMKGVDCQKS